MTDNVISQHYVINDVWLYYVTCVCWNLKAISGTILFFIKKKKTNVSSFILLLYTTTESHNSAQSAYK